MKIGVRAHDFGRHSPEALAQTLAQAGFEAAQVAPTKAIAGIARFEDIAPQHIRALGEAFARANVEIAVLGCYIEPSVADEDARLRAVGHFQAALRQAAELGVRVVGTETTHFAGDEAQREAAYARLLDSVLRMVDEAERTGVQIGIEPVAEHTLHTPELARRLLDAVGSPKLRVILDPVNLILPEAEEQLRIYARFFELLGEDIVAIHAKDVVMEAGEKRWRAIGEGIVPYDWLFERFRRYAPNAPVLREGVTPQSYDSDRRALCALRDAR